MAIGDIDGDNVEEIVFAALADRFPRQCEPVDTGPFALDDLSDQHGFRYG